MRLRATPAQVDVARGSAELREQLLRELEAQVAPGRYTSGAKGRSAVVALIEQLEQSKVAPRFPKDLDAVDGSWDLLFTTNAVSLDANLLDTLAALPAGLPSLSPLLDGSPLASRRVRQEIDVAANRVRNCVTITAWPEGDGAFIPPGLKDLLAGLEGSDLTLTLDHLAVVEGAMSAAAARYAPARLRIELQQVRRVLEPGPLRASSVGAGLLDLVPKETAIDIPWPLSTLSPGRFDTTYVDESVRISRGVPPGKELRVFRRSATPTTVVSEGGM
ncbi:hypothetical protein KFE25_014017 [Diacronema lutheri]|uniref:Plastid lipid-associated protein/fibrillin conserved domain-containing protein n=1 Tax=Diacronema lutheri TaxID=2081491 RepID=A0A7R9UWX8_DIALT|nr:hypothetical protein KFE25_014017 [Diacronema lutheri]